MVDPGFSRGRRYAVLGGVCLALVAMGAAGRPAAQSARPIVFVVPIGGVVDLGLAPFLARTIRDAQHAGAAAVVLDINTFGGRVGAAVAMRDTLVDSPVRIIAYVHPRAISAGRSSRSPPKPS